MANRLRVTELDFDTIKNNLKAFLKQQSSFNLTGDLNVTGNITATKQISDAIRNMSADRSIYNSHVHSDPQGGQTGTPSASQSLE